MRICIFSFLLFNLLLFSLELNLIFELASINSESSIYNVWILTFLNESICFFNTSKCGESILLRVSLGISHHCDMEYIEIVISYDLLDVFIIWHWAQISDESYMSWILSKQLDFSFFFSHCFNNINLLSFYYLLMFPHSFSSLFRSSKANKSKSFWFSIWIFHNHDRSSFSTIWKEILKLVLIPLRGKVFYIDVCILVQLFVFIKSFNDDLFSRKFRLIQFIYCFKSLLFISKFHISISIWRLLYFRLVARESLWNFTANYFANFSEIWVEVWIVNKLFV